MICLRCAADNRPSAIYCAACGLKLDTRPEYQYVEAPKDRVETASGRAILSASLGISSFLPFCGPITGITAILLSAWELEKIKSGNSSGAGRLAATLGLWTGFVGSVVWLLYWIWKLYYSTPVSEDMILA
ncbi:MAG: hypothetical protein KDC45_01735 [Bacteroidetes bacterium]|nr:hypothetical protein [Bacteroidota bacterium]